MLARLNLESSVKLHLVNRDHWGYGHMHQLMAQSQLVSLTPAQQILWKKWQL